MTNSRTPTGFTKENVCPRLTLRDKVLIQQVWNVVTSHGFCLVHFHLPPCPFPIFLIFYIRVSLNDSLKKVDKADFKRNIK